MQKIQSFPELFNLALAFFKKHIHAIALISVIPTVLSGAVSAMSPHLGESGAGVTIYLGIIIAVTLIALIIFSVVYPVAFARSIEGTERGEVIDTARAYMTSIKDFFPYILVSLITFFVIIAGGVVFAIPGIIATVYFAFNGLTYALDGKRGFDALTSSAWLVKGRWMDVLGRFILLGLFLILASVISWGVIHIILSLIGFDASVSNFISGLVMAMIIAPFAFIFKYFLYRNLQSTLVQKDVDPAFAKKVKIWSIIGIIFGVLVSLLFSYFQIMFLVSGHFAS